MQLPLDRNFPEPIVDCLKPWMGSTELLPLRHIDERLTTLDDRASHPARWMATSEWRNWQTR